MCEGRVLLLDDEESILFGVREFLGAQGYTVECARTSAEARELLALDFDVLIADLRITPHEPAEGLEWIAWVHRARPRMRILVLTASGDDLEAEALRRGAHVFLQKPQPLSRVAALVNTLCREVAAATGAPVPSSPADRRREGPARSTNVIQGEGA